MITKSGKRLPDWMSRPKNTPERQDLRNRTFELVAKAMADQWNFSPNSDILETYYECDL
jgi:hypothetical protein